MELIGIGLVSLFGFFTVGFLASRAHRNWSWVDVLWTFSFPFLCVVLMLWEGELFRFIPFVALTLMYAIWALRLGTHLSRRILRLHPVMEGRYLKLAAQWKRHETRSFFLFFMAQAVLAAILATPVFFMARPGELDSNAWIIGVVFWLLAFFGELVADAQLESFKADPNNKGAVCEKGLWAYSRHPNYFFEWLMWVAYALMTTLVHKDGWISFIAPLLMLLLVTKVTGIPPTEAQSLRSRGDAFRDYQRRVSAFVPWKPKR
ncbi:MAG: DUF1295 domain-containing protein [Bdellovibrionota bacterium]